MGERGVGVRHSYTTLQGPELGRHIWQLTRVISSALCMIQTRDIHSGIFNRPGVAWAVLQSPLSFNNSLTQSVILCENIFKTPFLPSRES